MGDKYLASVGVLVFVGAYWFTDAMLMAGAAGVVAAGIWYSLPERIKPDVEGEDG